MLFLPAAALCCLCSALVTMAAEQLTQEDLTLTRRVGESVSFSCGGTEQCYGTEYGFWYQKKENETFRVILRIYTNNCGVHTRYGHPQENDFLFAKKQNSCEMKIEKVKLDHSATYYCNCYNRWYFIFGSGTKLSVTDEQVVKPVVSVYPAASRAHLEGNSSLLCVASAMFPPLVQFSWKRQKKNGGEAEELPPAEGEQLELRESGRTIAIRMVDGSDSDTYKYSCWVKHEGGTVEAQTQQEVPAPAASCPPEREPADLPALQPADLSFQSQCRVKLLCLLYTVLIVKSLVYCCGLSLLMILTNKGASTNCTHAD
ncbi:immunoglobulin lambda-1 light chain-like [Pelmatolapia mariae]|uniref:immunoglobulin lambda-1 light chain-like n=1 Tax=Pelmatolapia mariae TaxID=158779 RepID=UPI002FE5428C